MAALCALPFQLISGLRQDDAPSERPAPGIARCARWLPPCTPCANGNPFHARCFRGILRDREETLEKGRRGHSLDASSRLVGRTHPIPGQTPYGSAAEPYVRADPRASLRALGAQPSTGWAWRCSYGWRQSVSFVPRCGLIHLQMGRRPTPAAVPRSGDDTAARLARGMEVGHRDPRTQFPPNLRCRYGHSSRCDVSGPRR